MIHSAVLIDLRRSATLKLYYDPTGTSYNGSLDDVIIFAHSVAEAGQFIIISN